jgi:hypothetical protein
LRAGDRTNKGIRRRTRRPGHFGLLLSVFALCLQLVAPGLHSSLQRSGAGNGDLARLLGEHALCLGTAPNSSSGKPAPPAEPPKDHRDDFASCCFWHGNAAQPAPGIAAGVAVSFDITDIAFPPTTYPVVLPAHPSSNFSARAPPVST